MLIFFLLIVALIFFSIRYFIKLNNSTKTSAPRNIKKKEGLVTENFDSKFFCFLSLNEKEKAKELLFSNMMHDIDDYKRLMPHAEQKDTVAFIGQKYGKYFDALGMKVDLSIFNENKQS